ATQVVGAGPRALDFGAQPTTYAVELGGGRGIEHLKELKSFTLTGWLNVRILDEGGADKFASAGNRVVSWILNGKDGVEVVQRADGSLQLGVNEWAEGSPARSQPAQLGVPDPKATNAFENNWRFFAVTYDGTAAAQHVKWYVGNKNADAKAAGSADYPRGPIGPKPCPVLTVGNAPPGPSRGNGDRMFRGAIDEIRVFGSSIDGSGALTLEQIIAVQGRPKLEAAKK
ncbi:MAG TPA: LamG-like jellyroll fold domain-containing protein, partial [Planctomycetota bacterium]|nr:LamG-like jellyroll fold domain-containing protein [Planctomycetota bacterium]